MNYDEDALRLFAEAARRYSPSARDMASTLEYFMKNMNFWVNDSGLFEAEQADDDLSWEDAILNGVAKK